jgi:hypothetical protein
MKTVASIIVLVVMPLGFFVLAALIAKRMLAKLRRQRAARLQTPSASTQGDRTGHLSAPSLSSVEVERAAATPTS